MDKQANSVRMPPDRILPACVGLGLWLGAASRRRAGVHVRFKTTSLLARAYARRPRARERDRRTDRRNLEFARAAVRLLRDTDGNTVQRTVPPTAPPPLTTTRTAWHWSSNSRPGREEESRRSCESCDLRQQKNWKRQATDGQVGPGELAGQMAE